MSLVIEKYVARQQKNVASLPRKFDLCWAIDLGTKKPVMFEVLNIDAQYGERLSAHLPEVQSGMLVKISVDWVSSEYMNESFWVEVKNVNVDTSGAIHFFGTSANDTERLDYGSAIGPIYPRNIIMTKGE